MRKKEPAYIKAEKTTRDKTSNKSFLTSISLNTDLQLTDKQESCIKAITDNTLTVIQGPAGTAKTYTACYAALKLLLSNKIDKIIVTRPIVEASESLGFLPGLIEDKIAPYAEAFYSIFESITDKYTVETLKSLNLIEFKPIAYLRGLTFKNCFIICDEAQNTDIKGLMLVTTRLGLGSKLAFCGDISQNDIQRKKVKLLEFSNMIEGMKDSCNYKFENKDVLRSKFLIELADRYEKYKDTLEE